MTVENQIIAELALSPEGHLYLNKSDLAAEQLSLHEFEKISTWFSKDSSAGLLHLGIQEFTKTLPPSFLFWQTFSRQFLTHVCKSMSTSEEKILSKFPEPNEAELQELINQALFIKGVEYINLEVLHKLWRSLGEYLQQELTDFIGSLQDYLNQYNPRWNLLGRVCFHLAENKNNEERPFAFLATYTSQLSQRSDSQHLPLKRALQDYAGEKNHEALLKLLVPVQKAASQSPFINELVESGALFQPLTWTAREAHQFLKNIPLMESCGIIARVPNWWNAQKPPRPKVMVKVGENKQSSLGLNTLLDFDMHLTLSNGEKITREEWQALMNSSGSLVKIKGQWVEVDRDKLKSVLSHWDKILKASVDGLSMAEGLRLIAGAGENILADDNPADSEILTEWTDIAAGDWLKKVLDQLRNPSLSDEKSLQKTLKQYLQASLRPYQQAGVQWLWLLYQIKLGGCLADDMGLGKTIQVLSLLLLIKHHSKPALGKLHLLVVPASLIGNWQAEIDRFAPSLKIFIAHSSANKLDVLQNPTEKLATIDIVITTYAFIHRLAWFKEIDWDLVILDEAQWIKNPGTKQTKAVKTLKSQIRLALTGTPIENRLGDLWSLFDFSSPGLLGSSKQFSDYSKKASKDTASEHYKRFISTLRNLTQPYILRRLKCDKKIIADLPDKTVLQTFCSLTKEQIQLYQMAISELSRQLQELKGIQRKGIVLSFLLRFKQICNHPTQWLGYGEYAVEESGKFIRLREICEEIAAKQEKVLVFTQFREIIPALSALLSKVFKQEGLELHGDTPIKKRAELVSRFQEERGPPFFILSLKAGGTGLNLTRASHVIHFDRWWNPSVENQATDRAYRIGQKHPVMVHKFVCRGTVEEKIDELIQSKENLSHEILGGGGEISLTEFTNEELLKMISLDIQQALGEF